MLFNKKLSEADHYKKLEDIYFANLVDCLSFIETLARTKSDNFLEDILVYINTLLKINKERAKRLEFLSSRCKLQEIEFNNILKEYQKWVG